MTHGSAPILMESNLSPNKLRERLAAIRFGGLRASPNVDDGGRIGQRIDISQERFKRNLVGGGANRASLAVDHGLMWRTRFSSLMPTSRRMRSVSSRMCSTAEQR